MTGAYVLTGMFVIGALVAGANLYRSLKTDVATLRMVSVSRTDDGPIYWSYILAMVFGLSIFVYFTALFLALMFPEAGITIWPMKN
jgi:hypothetical protein